MAVAFLDKDLGIEIFEKEMRRTGKEGTNTIQLAVSSAALGYNTKLFTKTLAYNEENSKLDYYKEHDSMGQNKFDNWLKRAEELKVKMEQVSLGLNEILNFVTENSLPIVLIDWNVIENKNTGQYRGHFLPIVGYDQENIYVHNPSFDKPLPFQAIRKDIFDKARKSIGTDEDILVVSKS